VTSTERSFFSFSAFEATIEVLDRNIRNNKIDAEGLKKTQDKMCTDLDCIVALPKKTEVRFENSKIRLAELERNTSQGSDVNNVISILIKKAVSCQVDYVETEIDETNRIKSGSTN